MKCRIFSVLVIVVLIFLPLTLKAAVEAEEKVCRGESRCINAHKIEKKVTNNGSRDILAPTNTLKEWQAFLSKHPQTITIGNCVSTPPKK